MLPSPSLRSMQDVRKLVQIYIAESVLEAALIRRTLTEHGVPCIIPGEDLGVGTESGLDENAIFVPVDRRDEAMGLLQEAWDFFGPVEDGTDR